MAMAKGRGASRVMAETKLTSGCGVSIRGEGAGPVAVRRPEMGVEGVKVVFLKPWLLSADIIYYY
jgi:hypothetical protein